MLDFFKSNLIKLFDFDLEKFLQIQLHSFALKSCCLKIKKKVIKILGKFVYRHNQKFNMKKN